MSKCSMIPKVKEELLKQTVKENLKRTKKSFRRWKWISNGVLLSRSPVSKDMTPAAGVAKLRPSTDRIKCQSLTLSVQTKAVLLTRLRQRLSTAIEELSVRKVLRCYETNGEDRINGRERDRRFAYLELRFVIEGL